MNRESLSQTVVELIENLLKRIAQLNSISDDFEQNIKERFVFFIDDLVVLIKAVESLEINVDVNELNYILSSFLDIMENDEYHLLQDVLSHELSPLLIHWRGLLDNE